MHHPRRCLETSELWTKRSRGGEGFRGEFFQLSSMIDDSNLLEHINNIFWGIGARL